MYVYHVVTERPMFPGQVIEMDETYPSGVYRRVQEKLETVKAIYEAPEQYRGMDLEHHTAVALRELALEEIRQAAFPQYPSRMHCLYASASLEEAERWGEFFARIGRPTYQIVRLEVEGRCFAGNAERCFRGQPDQKENLRLARAYWENPWDASCQAVRELLVDGRIRVAQIVKEIPANLG